MKKIKHYIFITIAVVLFASLQSCKPLQTWERIYVNDPEMQMGKSRGAKFENYVESIREGNTIPGSTKSSGGCGCN